MRIRALRSAANYTGPNSARQTLSTFFIINEKRMSRVTQTKTGKRETLIWTYEMTMTQRLTTESRANNSDEEAAAATTTNKKKTSNTGDCFVF